MRNKPTFPKGGFAALFQKCVFGATFPKGGKVLKIEKIY
jgi:hypothetical protein